MRKLTSWVMLAPIFGLILILFPTGGALADTLSEIYTIADQSVSYTDTLTVNKFNTSLGVLTGIEIESTATANLSFNAFNNTTSSQTITLTGMSETMTITTPSGQITLNPVWTPASEETFSVSPGNNDGLATTGPISASVTTNPTDFSDYESSGAATMLWSVYAAGGNVSANTPPGVYANASGTAGGTVTVIYNYTPAAVPEPATLLLVGVGFLGLAVFYRKA